MPAREQVTVGAAVAVLVDRNIYRELLIIENRSVGAQIIYLDSSSDVSATKGIAIIAGGNVTMEKSNRWPVTKKWWVIASAAGALVNIFEGYPDPSLPPSNGGNSNNNTPVPNPPGMDTPAGGDC